MSPRPAQPLAQDPPGPWPEWLSRIAADLRAYKARVIRLPRRKAERGGV
jgi:hypothetical protein